MQKRFEVTYDNHTPIRTLKTEVTKTVFADNANEARQFCDDVYNDCNGYFRIIEVKES
tara:strand:+ start:125 stop:298 length:174 start_codon:yes stop_codon:yes gene_type:complete